MSESNTNLIMLNGQEYELSIMLSNPDKAINIPKILFSGLTFTESIIDWKFNGYLDYINNYEQIERFKVNTKKKNTELFYFRMDGTDKLTVKLKPTFNNSNLSMQAEKALDTPVMKNMELSFTASIYDSEDLFPSNISTKIKRLYFWDSYYNKSVESNLPMSSGEYLRSIGIDPSNLSDSARAVESGDLLKYIFHSKLDAPVSENNWDFGGNKLIYTAPAMYTLNDSITFLIDRHVSKNGFPAFISYNRFSDEYELISYDMLFSRYDSMLKERFAFPDNTTTISPIGPARAKKNNTYDLGPFSVMQSYVHTKMAGMDSMKAINSKSVNWYDPVSKIFKTSIEKNHVSTAKEKFKSLVSVLNSTRSTPMFTLNKMKSENKSIEHRYISGAYKENGDLAAGASNTFRAALFLNDCIEFSVIGAPIRSAGKFIEIYSDVDLQGIWEDRFLGAWLTTEVTHTIDSSTYSNTIIAVKPNATENFDVPENV
jgi:hypothetical protein